VKVFHREKREEKDSGGKPGYKDLKTKIQVGLVLHSWSRKRVESIIGKDGSQGTFRED